MIRRLLRWSLYALGLLLLIVVGLLGALQTGPGKRFIAAKLTETLSTPEAGIEIAGIEGWIPLDMRVGGVRLSDREGTWLSVDDIVLDWSPSALLSGRVQIDELGAGRVEVARPPISDETAPPPPPGDEPFRLPELPSSIPPLTVERLAVPEIVLGEPILGEAARFSLEGSVRSSDDGEKATAGLDLRRTDEESAAASVDATLDLASAALDLAFEAEETGGLVGRLAGRDDIGALTASLNGKGPLADWTGRLEADADGLGQVGIDLGLALVDQPRVAISGEVSPGSGLLPPDLAALIGETTSVDLEVIQTEAQALDLQKVHIDTKLGTLGAAGSVDFEGGSLALDATLDLPDLAPVGPLAKADLGGSAAADLSLTGTIDAPEGRLALKAGDLSLDGNRADAIDTVIDVSTTEPLSSDTAAFGIRIDGQASGLAIPDTPLPDDTIAWQAALAVPLEGAITIERAAIETAETTLAAEGSINPAVLEGTVDLTLDAPSLRRLAKPYGQTVDGRAQMSAAITLGQGGEDVDVDLDAALEQLAGLPPGAAELLGQSVTLKAEAGLADGKTATLRSMALDAGNIALNGLGEVLLDRGTIEGRLDVALPDLSVLEDVAAAEFKGAVDLGLTLGGTIEAPSADLLLTSRDLVLAGEPVSTLNLAADGQDLIASPTGTLSLDLNARKTPTSLKLAYNLADQLLNLENIALKAPETDIGGDVAVALDAQLIDGALQGRSADLEALAALIGQRIAGNAELKATLKPVSGKQRAVLSLKAGEIEGDFGKVKTVTLDATVEDALGEPGLDGKATITGFEQGDTAVDALTLAARGSRKALDLKLKTTGEAIEAFDLALDGRLGMADGLSLDLARLEGTFAEEPLRLEKPLSFRQRGDALTLSDLDLRLGEARLSGNVDLGERTAGGSIDLRSLPLSWSEVFGGPALEGDVNADIDLSGTVARPTIDAAVRIEDLIGKDVGVEETPIDIALDALLDRGRLQADFSADGLTKKPITANASLPMTLALRPFAFEAPQDGALEGAVDIELQLARLSDLLALDGQTLAGLMQVDLTIGGSLVAPEVEGPIVLSNGRYANEDSGTDIRDLNMQAVASTERVEVSRLSGRTGETGTLEADGWLDLDGEADFPLSVSLRLDQARLVDRDDADARISGELRMLGNLAQPVIESDLTVNRAEIQIPEGGGVNLPELTVEEVGGNIVNPPVDDTAEAEKQRPIDPLLRMHISLPNKVFVRGRGLESEWQGDLRINGKASNPLIVGDLSIRKGYFDFLDKRFELEQGEISFSGSSPPNPILALTATSGEDDFKAIIRLTGPASDPQILLESEPVLPEDEILARLLFNRKLSEIGAVEAAKLALALNRLRGGGGFDAFGEIRNILRIDTLDVVSDDEGESKVRAGKYLNDDVYVEVEKGAADQSGRARVEIEVLPNIAVEAETSENANSGVGVKWKLDY